MKPRAASGGLVYSTDSGRMCPACRRPIADCVCKAAAAIPVKAGKPKVTLDTKGRGGKSVTVVRGLPLEAEALATLAKQLRTACGSGGTVKDGVVEIQGDHCAKVLELLRTKGFLL